MSIITLNTIGAQLTPFPAIDDVLLRADQLLYFDTIYILSILQKIPFSRDILTISYWFIIPELAFLPCILAILQQYDKLNRLYFMLLLTSLIGFLIYYFWPTMAPASILHSPYFIAEQYETKIKFLQIHNHQMITSYGGGMVAMPSFHVIWALLCQKSVKNINKLWWILLPINCLLILSTVILGWHYVIDIIASFILVFMCEKISKKLEQKTAVYK